LTDRNLVCRLVADAARGKHIEHVPCSPPPMHRKMENVLSEKVLKVSQQLKYMYNHVFWLYNNELPPVFVRNLYFIIGRFDQTVNFVRPGAWLIGRVVRTLCERFIKAVSPMSEITYQLHLLRILNHLNQAKLIFVNNQRAYIAYIKL